MKVVAALSGGVDSAVAAARAVEAGHEVVGVHLALSASRETHRVGSRGCCTLEDARDARRIADVLGIPFYVWDLSEEFRREVVDDFIAEYQAGRTPNPCIRCNESIKFSAVLNKARGLGFDAVCTGHYARIENDQAGGLVLKQVSAGSWLLTRVTAMTCALSPMVTRARSCALSWATSPATSLTNQVLSWASTRGHLLSRSVNVAA